MGEIQHVFPGACLPVCSGGTGGERRKNGDCSHDVVSSKPVNQAQTSHLLVSEFNTSLSAG
jgi:hypothetical protein